MEQLVYCFHVQLNLGAHPQSSLFSRLNVRTFAWHHSVATYLYACEEQNGSYNSHRSSILWTIHPFANGFGCSIQIPETFLINISISHSKCKGEHNCIQQCRVINTG